MIFDETMPSVDIGEKFLAHYGVPGMHWGIRKSIVDMLKGSPPAQKAQQVQSGLSSQQKTNIKRAAIGVGVGVVGAYAVGGLALHMHTNPAPYIKAATYAGNAMRNTMSTAQRAAAGSRVVFNQGGKMTYYPPGARPNIRPNFDPAFSRQAINVTQRALNP